VYAKLVAQGEEEESGRVAGAVFSLLALVTSVLVLLGVLATPLMIDLIAPGFHDARRPLTIQLVRIFFPGVGLLVLSAWCLGILNSHRKFFLSYVSPVMWNLAIIAGLVAFGRHSSLPQLAIYAAWASVVGSGLQFLVQLPVVLRLAPRLKFALGAITENVRVVIRNFVPVFISRGVVQLSAYVDAFLASYLPGMSSALGNEREVADSLRRRITSSTKRIGFFVVPSAMAFLALGNVVAAVIFQRGRFTSNDTL